MAGAVSNTDPKPSNMAGGMHDSFMSALRSENVSVIISIKHDGQAAPHSMPVPRALLGSKSDAMERMIEKGESTLDLQHESPTAVNMFIRWCYKDRLEDPLTSTSSAKQRNEWKDRLIDLWIFAARWDIPRLQNQAMQALLTFFAAHANLLHRDDIGYIWTRTQNVGLRAKELKWLVVYTMIAQIEEEEGEIKDFQILAGFDGFFPMAYKALTHWYSVEVPKTPQKKKATKSKWGVIVVSDDVKRKVLVKEVVATPKTPKKRGHDGEGGGWSAEKRAKGFTPGEVITIDDD